jgi:hypothetical protein
MTVIILESLEGETILGAGQLGQGLDSGNGWEADVAHSGSRDQTLQITTIIKNDSNLTTSMLHVFQGALDFR